MAHLYLALFFILICLPGFQTVTRVFPEAALGGSEGQVRAPKPKLDSLIEGKFQPTSERAFFCYR